MKIALIGYGKMGKAIEAIAQQKSHEIVARIKSADFKAEDLNGADVAIEFTVPEAAAKNIMICFDANIPVVVGTTAWYHDFNAIKDRAIAENQSLFTATNFSIGVNILFHINKQLASTMNSFEEYEVSMNETHHIHKKDHPSGTAVTLAEGIIDSLDRKKNYVGQLKGEQADSSSFDLHITSSRENEVPGFHEISYKSEIDEIKLSHNAFNRQGFAKGAVIAAEWLYGKKGVFGMNDLLNLK
ncbi:MAG: 4-hydroxy-tetrahydrodipicolinate reductase [Bacteroidia bacterium]